MPSSDLKALYIHGFGSAPESTKALRFKKALSELDIECICPDFNVPTLETMSVTAMLELAKGIILADGADWYIVGSSLGGFVTLKLLEDPIIQKKVKKILLLAPVLSPRGTKRFNNEFLAHWQRHGKITLKHEFRKVSYDLEWKFFEQFAANGNAILPTVPTLIIHGTLDQSVEYAESKKFTESSGEQQSRLVQFVSLEMDHSMLSHLHEVISIGMKFFQS